MITTKTSVLVLVLLLAGCVKTPGILFHNIGAPDRTVYVDMLIYPVLKGEKNPFDGCHSIKKDCAKHFKDSCWSLDSVNVDYLVLRKVTGIKYDTVSLRQERIWRKSKNPGIHTINDVRHDTTIYLNDEWYYVYKVPTGWDYRMIRYDSLSSISTASNINRQPNNSTFPFGKNYIRVWKTKHYTIKPIRAMDRQE